MPENSQESPEVNLPTETTPRGEDQQSLLLKLAERTVLQAEALAQEITEQARQGSEAEGARLLAQYTEQAKAEAQEVIEFAKRRSETLIHEATTKALAESENMLSKALAESENMFSKAQSEAEEMLSKARSESEEILGNSQVEVQEILGKTRQEATAIIKVSQARADSAESHARLKAEFIIRQTTQTVADGIRSAVLETCNKLLPTVDALENEIQETQVAKATSPENGDSNETEEIPSQTGTVHTDTTPETPSNRRAKT